MPAPAPTIQALAAAPATPTIPFAPTAPSAAPTTLGAAALSEAFLAGYAAGGGPPELAPHFTDVAIPCESGWRTDPPGYHLGMLQFAPATWRKAARAGADYRDPWEQGFAAGNWIGPMGVDPGSRAGWAGCW